MNGIGSIRILRPDDCATEPAATSTILGRYPGRSYRFPKPRAHRRSPVSYPHRKPSVACSQPVRYSGVGDRIVTTAPDVAISTISAAGSTRRGLRHAERDDHGGADRLLKWAPAPTGQHIELGISEMNLFMLLGQLGLSHDHHGEHLLPIGTVYDPFVLRGLDAFIYGVYNGSRFVVTGTPSGVTLAPEGGAHQSTLTASVGAELPDVHYCEPAYATEVDWLLCDALDQLGHPDGSSCYLRLSTRPIDQAPFAAALDAIRRSERCDDSSRRRLSPDRRPRRRPTWRHHRDHRRHGARGDRGGRELDDEGVQAAVIHLTSPDRTYRSWQQRIRPVGGSVVRKPSQLHRLVPVDERAGLSSACTMQRATASRGSARRWAPVNTLSGSTASANRARSPICTTSPASRPATSSTLR